jgi:multidrug resistance efflux pump
MGEKEFDGKETQELEQAEGHLRKAEADLESARAAERAAEHEIDEALQEIEDAEVLPPVKSEPTHRRKLDPFNR